MNKNIKYNVINSLLAGALVMLGSISNGEFTIRSVYFGVVAGLLVAVTKFRDYWTAPVKKPKTSNFFNFI